MYCHFPLNSLLYLAVYPYPVFVKISHLLNKITIWKHCFSHLLKLFRSQDILKEIFKVHKLLNNNLRVKLFIIK